MEAGTTMKAIRWHPPSFDQRLDDVPVPMISHPDDAIVKVKLAGLCGSDLHIYRGHASANVVHISGHEFVGTVIQLGTSFATSGASNESAQGRPELYSTLKVGDEVVGAFTSTCGECHSCRTGLTCRCPKGRLFGSPLLEGAQAQYVRVPYAGGTLFPLSPVDIKNLAPHSLLLLADIVPTGIFAAVQVLSHPKTVTALTGVPWPYSALPQDESTPFSVMKEEDTDLTFAIVGLGPVGLCATVALLDQLATRFPDRKWRIMGVDPLEARRKKFLEVYESIGENGKGKKGEIIAQDPDGAEEVSKGWPNGCTAVLEVVGNPSALKLSYSLVRPGGVITSVGVHSKVPVPFVGSQMYDKNVSFDFGRCPARAMIPLAYKLLVKRQDVFGGSPGDKSSLVEKIVGFHDGEIVKNTYEGFDKGVLGKVAFDPWAV